MSAPVTAALVAQVRAAICAEIDRQMEGHGWSVPWSLDAVARAAAQAALERRSAPA